ncbi:MAG: small, acid-soluble spore protein, alpha/beta type [Clostridia bacterium]|nr:small, acid-soluble spore protein, alpha/beta type [Clostridia bacterium]
MANKQAKEALNSLKMEAASEVGAPKHQKEKA